MVSLQWAPNVEGPLPEPTTNMYQVERAVLLTNPVFNPISTKPFNDSDNGAA